MKSVVILGAGASKYAGAPLINEFLDYADELRRIKADDIKDKISLVGRDLSRQIIGNGHLSSSSRILG